MNAQTSRISSEIDFERDGKQTGFLRLPHSIHRSAYGWLAIPVVCIANGPGPKVLLISGNHGDEYEGQVTLMKLARELELDGISGRVIIVSAANAPAARVGRRTSPLDFAGEGNLNRAFPGDANGSPTEMIAHYIVSELLPRADFVFDLHSGGTPCATSPAPKRSWAMTARLTPANRPCSRPSACQSVMWVKPSTTAPLPALRSDWV